MVVLNKQRLSLHQNIKINYPVYFMSDFFAKKNSIKLKRLCKNKKLLIVIDKNVSNIYGKIIKDFFKSLNTNSAYLDLDATEKKKNIQNIIKISYYARKADLSRDSIFIGIGGGITLDMVGLAAFLYRRKINYIRIPTTIVGIVDAGIGVKVGVNFESSKNFLGGYYAPMAVFSDQNFLYTISEKEIRSGLYEMLKIAIVKDSRLFNLLDHNYSNFIHKNLSKVTLKIMQLASYLMMKELEGNLYERDLKRKVDFGHTFSPFLETNSKFKIPHGQAVGIDVLVSSFIAFKRKLITKNDFTHIYDLIKKIGFSEKYKIPSPEKMFNSLSEIKKHRAGNINLVLPNGIGSCIFTNNCSINEIKTAVQFIKSKRILK